MVLLTCWPLATSPSRYWHWQQPFRNLFWATHATSCSSVTRLKRSLYAEYNNSGHVIVCHVWLSNWRVSFCSFRSLNCVEPHVWVISVGVSSTLRWNSSHWPSPDCLCVWRVWTAVGSGKPFKPHYRPRVFVHSFTICPKMLVVSVTLMWIHRILVFLQTHLTNDSVMVASIT